MLESANPIEVITAFVSRLAGSAAAAREKIRNQILFRSAARRWEPEPGSSRKVRIVDADGTFHRYLYCLAKCIQSLGYVVEIEMTSKAISRADTYVRLFASENMFAGIAPRSTKRSHLAISDEKGERVIGLDPMYFEAQRAERLPMPMHPFMYSKGFVNASQRLRDNDIRNVRVFFAGSRGATHRLLTERFEVDRREDVLACIMNTPQIPHVLLNDLAELSADHRGHVLLVISEVLDIPQDRLLEAMSRSSFFLALPGWIVPFSHNLTESMSVGSIPILQYASHLSVPLENGRNCLTYRSMADLVTVLNRALTMDEREIEKLRANVIDYYDRHLSSRAVMEIIDSSQSGTVALMAEQNSLAT